jgi:hypothetical protein
VVPRAARVVPMEVHHHQAHRHRGCGQTVVQRAEQCPAVGQAGQLIGAGQPQSVCEVAAVLAVGDGPFTGQQNGYRDQEDHPERPTLTKHHGSDHGAAPHG